MSRNKNEESTFTDKVLLVVKGIPQGEVLTYSQVAEKAGNVKASRAVGNIMANNYRDDIPCHRVICSSGKVGQYNRGGERAKRIKLRSEGVDIP